MIKIQYLPYIQIRELTNIPIGSKRENSLKYFQAFPSVLQHLNGKFKWRKEYLVGNYHLQHPNNNNPSKFFNELSLRCLLRRVGRITSSLHREMVSLAPLNVDLGDEKVIDPPCDAPGDCACNTKILLLKQIIWVTKTK